VDWEQWPTAGWEDKSIPPGMCYHFDGFKSPNVEGTKWFFLYTRENYLNARDAKERSLGWWSNNRGFWAPEGTCNTVLSEGMLVRCDVRAKPAFTTHSTRIAFFDPAFGGDAAVLRFAEFGPTVEAPEGCIVLGERVAVDPTPDAGEESEYALARRVKLACEARNVRPENFGIDAVGTGRGAAAVLATLWSQEVNKYDGRMAPSDDLIAWEDDRPAKEVFDRGTTENWFRVRGLVEGRQLKNLDDDTAAQFTTRTYTVAGRKYSLSTKEDCRLEVGHSPDDADAVVGLCWLAREKGMGERDTKKATPTMAVRLDDPAPVEDDAYLEAQPWE
jgi:hypothetical protein